MFRRLLVFGTISIVSIIVSASVSDSDLTWPSGDLFGSGLESDQTTSTFELAQSDGNTDAFLENTSPSLFSITDNNIFSLTDAEPIYENFYEIADCSTFSPLGKSRIRRRNDPTSCKNSASGTGVAPLGIGGGSMDDLDSIRDQLQPETLQALEQATADKKHNTFCFLVTGGELPFGVCSSPNPRNTSPNGNFLDSPVLGRFVMYALVQPTPGTRFSPFPSPLFEGSFKFQKLYIY